MVQLYQHHLLMAMKSKLQYTMGGRLRLEPPKYCPFENKLHPASPSAALSTQHTHSLGYVPLQACALSLSFWSSQIIA
jgi:hypothetical protein